MTLESAPPLHLRQVHRRGGDLGKCPEVEDVLSLSSGRRLLCRACGEPITSDEHRLAVAGRSVHRRSNPAGFAFDFGCFGRAPGAVAVGQTTAEHTWFAGFTWRCSICRGCGRHLGWLFEGAGSSFHGLILDRLEEETPESTS